MVNQGDLFGDDNNKELERLADEFDRNDDYLLEKELEEQGGKSFNPGTHGIQENHPLLDGFNKDTGRFDTTNYWEGAYGSRRKYTDSLHTDSWKVTPVKSTSEYLRNSYWGNSWYYDSYSKKADQKAQVHETLHEVLKELNKTINLTSNSKDSVESVMNVKYSNGAVINDFESNTLYISPNVMLKDDEEVRSGADYYESLDGLNGQAMLCSFMKKGIHADANADYKEAKEWAARNIFMCDIQASAAAEIFSKWPGFMSYITSQMQVFGVQKDYLLMKFDQPIILLDDLIETLCYNRLASEKVDYTIFHPDIVKKMLLADRDFNQMIDTPCKSEDRFKKAQRIYESIRDTLNLEKAELEVKWSQSGLSFPSKSSEGVSGEGTPVSGDDNEEVGNPQATNQIDNSPSDEQRRFTGDNSYNNKMEVDGDVVFNILDHNKKLRERLKELGDKLASPAISSDEIINKEKVVYKLLVPPVNVETIKAYDEYVKMNKKNINAIKDAMMFHNNYPWIPSYGLTDGDIDEHALYKMHFGEYERLFERRDQVTEKRYHITLVIDQSGSMSGEKLEQANKLCILFAEALKFLRNTEYSIYGFETRDINTWVYKDKLYDKQKALIEPVANGGTAMGYHLASIGDKVINQYSDFDNKFMFVICDGGPTHGVENMNSCQFTNHSIKLLRRQGIQVYGIGILNAFQERTGNEIFGEGNFTVIDDIKGSLSILTNRLRKYLQKSSKV